jgi:Gpi18-like mannosyltransferase
MSFTHKRKRVSNLALLLGCAVTTSSPVLASTTDRVQDAPLVTQEFRYRSPEAGEVYLAWGLNGWNTPPEALRPAGTQLRNGVIHTPMTRTADTFSAVLRVPFGTSIDYGFLTTKTRAGSPTKVWEPSGGRSHRAVASADSIIGIDGGTNTRLPWRGVLMLLLGFGVVFVIAAIRGNSNFPLLSRLRPLAHSNLTKLVGFALVARIVLFAIGYAACAAAANPNANYVPFSKDYLTQELHAFARADVTWYMSIASHGYERRPFSLDQHANWAFYPLWPILLRLASLLIPNMVTAGILASTFLFLGALVLLYRLVVLDFSPEVAMTTCLLLLVFPVSYFFSRPGPESLFLLLVVACLRAARKARWGPAGLIGALAALCRMQGVLLLLPLAYLYYRQYQESGRHNPRALSVLMLPAALIGFMLHLYALTGNPFAAMAIERVFDLNTTLPFASMIRYLSEPSLVQHYGYDLSIFSFVFLFAAVLLTCTLIARHDVPRDYVIYAVVSLVLVLTVSTMSGAMRYMLPIFPLFLVGALLIRGRWMTTLLVCFGFAGLQAFYFIGFVLQYNWAAN